MKRCRRSKTPVRLVKAWQKSWLYSVGNTWNPSQWLRRIISTTSRQSSEPEVNWIFGWDPEISKGCVRNCCPSDHWAIHLCQDASTSELNKSINQAHLENGTYEQIVSNLETEIELNDLKAPDELRMNTVTLHATNSKTEKPNPTRHHCKKPGHHRNQCCQLRIEKDQTEGTKNSAGNNNNGQTNSNPNNSNANNRNNNKTHNRNDRKPQTFYPPCETCGKANHSTEKCFSGANASIKPPPRHRRPIGQSQNQLQSESIAHTKLCKW